MSLLRFSFQNETLILDDLLYLYKVNAVRHSYLYESPLGAREAQEKDVNTCFYYLFLQAKLSCMSTRHEIHFIPERNPFWNNAKGTLGTDQQIFDAGGGRVFCQLYDVFSFIKPVLDFFGGYCPTPPFPAQHPPSPPPPHQKSTIRSYNFLCDERIWIHMYYSRCCCFFTLPSELFQVIISGSKKQQQKDSYQSEVPFSVIPGRTP